MTSAYSRMTEGPLPMRSRNQALAHCTIISPTTTASRRPAGSSTRARWLRWAPAEPEALPVLELAPTSGRGRRLTDQEQVAWPAAEPTA